MRESTASKRRKLYYVNTHVPLISAPPISLLDHDEPTQSITFPNYGTAAMNVVIACIVAKIGLAPMRDEPFHSDAAKMSHFVA